LAVLAYTGYQA